MPELKQLWESAMGEIEMSVSPANFSTWFKNTSLIKEESGVVFVGVPNSFVKEWLSSKYHLLILKSLRNTYEEIRSVEYVISKQNEQRFSHYGEQQNTQKNTQNNQFPLGDLYINKENNLNPRYTFDSFIIGSFNELAYAASQAIIKKPGFVYNPFFIYGQTGLGKTHLIQSIGNFLKEKHNLKVFYTTSEKYSYDYTTSVQNNNINRFKEKYRQYDVFIMDDIQFLSKKDRTQEELFHLFNELYENNKQIIFSSDKHHNYIPNLEDRLKSRFSQGMIVDVFQPDYESRLMIIKRKLEPLALNLSDEVLEHIATHINGNIREIEGILNTLSCQEQLKLKPLSLFDVKEIIKNNSKPKKMFDIVEITKKVAEFYNLDEGVIYKKTRRKEIVRPRQILMYILREDFQTSFPMIGQKLGGRDHTTVIHACEKIRNDLKKDSGLIQELERLRLILQ